MLFEQCLLIPLFLTQVGSVIRNPEVGKLVPVLLAGPQRLLAGYKRHAALCHG